MRVVATRSFDAGEPVVALQWQHVQPEPDRWTIQIGIDAHAMPVPEELRYLNHSCEPTVDVDIDAGAVRARRPLAPGDELSFFYPSTEWELTEPFTCRCGEPSCIGVVAGAKHLPTTVLDRYEPSPTVRRLASRSHSEAGR